MTSALLAFGALLAVAITVLLVGHLQQTSLKWDLTHASQKSAVRKADLSPPPVVKTEAPGANEQPPTTAAKDTHVHDEYDALPVDTAVTVTEKDVPWLPGTTKRNKGVVLTADGRRVGWEMLHPIKPRAMILHNVLSPEDCAALVDYASEFMQRSRVIGESYHGANKVDQVRTSTGMFMMGEKQEKHPLNLKLRASAMAAVGINEDSFIEGTQILHYKRGQYYRPHADYFAEEDEANLNRGGQRLITILTWLTDVKSGGATSFPMAEPKPVKKVGKVGDAIAFYSVDEQGGVDITSTHGGEPPGVGANKWVAVLWIHAKSFV